MEEEGRIVQEATDDDDVGGGGGGGMATPSSVNLGASPFSKLFQTPPNNRRNSTSQSPRILRAPQLDKFPVPEVLAALFIECLPEGSTAEEVKQAMSNAVDTVFTEEAPCSPTSSGDSSLSFRQVKEDIVSQVPTFVETLNKLHNGPAHDAGRKSVGAKNSAKSPRKKRKLATSRLDPTSFSEEELSEEDESCELESMT